MSIRETVEEGIAAGLDDNGILDQISPLERAVAEGVLSDLRGRAQLSTDQKRDRSALMLEIITRRAIGSNDLQAAVAAQKALAALEGLEMDPAIAGAQKTDDLPTEQVDARIRELLRANPELRAAVLTDG